MDDVIITKMTQYGPMAHTSIKAAGPAKLLLLTMPGKSTCQCRGLHQGSVTLFQLAPLLECDDIPVTLMSALGSVARPAPCQHATNTFGRIKMYVYTPRVSY